LLPLIWRWIESPLYVGRALRAYAFFNLKIILHKSIVMDIVNNMKTTIDISDSLLREAKKLTAKKMLHCAR
jgi:hypothetical protein